MIQLVMWNALLPIGTGVVVGLGGSLALTGLIAARLWGVTSTDPTTFASVAALLAVRADPTAALRYE